MPYSGNTVIVQMPTRTVDEILAELARRGYKLNSPLKEKVDHMNFDKPPSWFDTLSYSSYDYSRLYPQHSYPTVRRLNGPKELTKMNEYMTAIGLQIEKELLKAVLTGDKNSDTLKTSNTGEKNVSKFYERTFTDWNTAVQETEEFSTDFDAFTDAMANNNTKFREAHANDEITEAAFLGALAEAAMRAYNSNRYRVEITHRKVVIEKAVSVGSGVYTKLVEFELAPTFGKRIVVRVYRDEKQSEWQYKG